jgi:hypothetical protein
VPIIVPGYSVLPVVDKKTLRSCADTKAETSIDIGGSRRINVMKITGWIGGEWLQYEQIPGEDYISTFFLRTLRRNMWWMWHPGTIQPSSVPCCNLVRSKTIIIKEKRHTIVT